VISRLYGKEGKRIRVNKGKERIKGKIRKK